MSGPDTQAAPERALCVADYLDADLVSYARMRNLASLADKAAARPLADLLENLRGMLRERHLEGAAGQRLHVLLSQLYHADPAVDVSLTRSTPPVDHQPERPAGASSCTHVRARGEGPAPRGRR